MSYLSRVNTECESRRIRCRLRRLLQLLENAILNLAGIRLSNGRPPGTRATNTLFFLSQSDPIDYTVTSVSPPYFRFPSSSTHVLKPKYHQFIFFPVTPIGVSGIPPSLPATFITTLAPSSSLQNSGIVLPTTIVSLVIDSLSGALQLNSATIDPSGMIVLHLQLNTHLNLTEVVTFGFTAHWTSA